MIFTVSPQTDDDVEDDEHADEECDSDERERRRELISQKLKKDKGAEKTTAPAEEERGKSSRR